MLKIRHLKKHQIKPCDPSEVTCKCILKILFASGNAELKQEKRNIDTAKCGRFTHTNIYTIYRLEFPAVTCFNFFSQDVNNHGAFGDT